MSLIRPRVRVLAEGLDFPEGPAFDSQNRLWFVELKGGHICRLDGEKMVRIPTAGNPNGLTVGADDRIWFCDAHQNSIRVYDPRTETFETICAQVDGEPLNKPNDLAFDRVGNLLFTCPGESRWEPTGYVCCLSPDRHVSRIADQLYFPNGLAFVSHGDELVVAETRRQRLWKGVWDGRQKSWPCKPWASIGGNIGPDGMALAADGALYVAVYSSGNIKSVLPDGEVLNLYELPGANPTNCAFDPSGKWGLIVTETEHGRLLGLPELGIGAPLFKH